MVLIVFAYVQQGPWQQWKEKAGKPDNFLKEIDPEKVEKIEISRGTSSDVLIKEEKGWKIGGTKDFYASDADAMRLKKALKGLSEGDLEVVSKNKDKKQDFKTGDKGAEIRIAQDERIIEFILGKNGPTMASCYISRKGDKKTYLLSRNIRTAFLKDDWRDEKMFSFMPERAKKIRFQYPDREFILEKKENIWKGISPYEFEADKEKLNDILETMGTLKAVEIPEQSFEGTGLEKHNIIVEVKGAMDDYVIMVGDANEEGLYYAKRGASDNIYLISEDDKNEFDVGLGDLQK